MAEILIVPMESRMAAMDALERLDDAVSDGRVTIKDAAMVYKTDKGKVKLHQTRGPTVKKGAAGGVVVGALVGALAGPIGWAAIGGGVIGGLWGRLRDKGVSNDMMKQVGKFVDEGKAVVFILADESSATAISALLDMRGMEHYSIPSEAEGLLEEAAKEEQQRAA